jgi:hypothetical protein
MNRLVPASAWLYLSMALSAAAAPSDQASSWVYAYPSYNEIALTQVNQLAGEQHFLARSSQAIGVRGGTSWGSWAVEGSAELTRFTVEATNPAANFRKEVSLSRVSIEAMRSVLSSPDLIGGINAHLRLGYATHNVPFLGPNITEPQLLNARVHALTVGGTLSTYLARRTRVSFSTRLLLPPRAVRSTGGASLEPGLDIDVKLGLQYLLNARWSLGVFGNWSHTHFEHEMELTNGQTDRGSLSFRQVAAQVHAGYQF